MSITDRLRKDHENLLKHASELANFLSEPKLKAEAKNVVQLLGRFSGDLKMHLSVEDNMLYPNLMRDPNPKVQATAKQFISEMGGVKAFVNDYASKWFNPTAISENPKQFIQDSKNLIKALEDRIQKENTQLYPLVEQGHQKAS